MNVAFNYSLKASSPICDCFIFHDVDMVPENDYNVYECHRNGPRHLSPAVDELRYLFVLIIDFFQTLDGLCFSLMYNELIGGALALTKDQFLKANGWSNLYWGWGVSFSSMIYLQ